MSRRLRCTVRGLPVDVVYSDRGGGDVVWYLASINWRLIATDRPLALTQREILAIDARCLADLRKRRQAWHRQLSARREAALYHQRYKRPPLPPDHHIWRWRYVRRRQRAEAGR